MPPKYFFIKSLHKRLFLENFPSFLKNLQKQQKSQNRNCTNLYNIIFYIFTEKKNSVFLLNDFFTSKSHWQMNQETIFIPNKTNSFFEILAGKKKNPNHSTPSGFICAFLSVVFLILHFVKNSFMLYLFMRHDAMVRSRVLLCRIFD